MKYVFATIILLLLVSCAGRAPSQSLGGLGLVKVYTLEDQGDTDCDALLKTMKTDPDFSAYLHSQTLADFEVDGFVTVQLGHIPAQKKFFVIVSATDPDTGASLGHGCVSNMEVQKGAIRDVPIILEAPEKKPQY